MTRQLLIQRGDTRSLARSSRNSQACCPPPSMVNGYPMEGNVVSFCKSVPYNIPPATANPASAGSAVTTTSTSGGGEASCPSSTDGSDSRGSFGTGVTTDSAATTTTITATTPTIITTTAMHRASTGTRGPASAATEALARTAPAATTSTTTTTSSRGDDAALSDPATLRGASGQQLRDTSPARDGRLCTELDTEVEQRLRTIEGVHAVFGSRLLHLPTQPDVPDRKVVIAVSGTGLAPWEIHRPQKFVRDLVLRRAFSGRVLDAGCGIGDNALYVAKAAPGAEVTAVDVVPRCLDFAGTKACMRGMRGMITLVVADLRWYDKLPEELRSQPYDVVLDSYMFHGLTDEDRESYMATLARLLRPEGMLYMGCMSEEETRPGGPRRVTAQELRRVFEGGGAAAASGAAASGAAAAVWRVEGVEDTVAELHPTFWGGKGRARLYTIRRLR